MAALLAGGLAACDQLGPPKRQPPLPEAAQAAAAEKLASAFAGACLTESSPEAAVRTLRGGGWPAFNTVWRRPDSAFYAAPPAPAGLFVLGDLVGSEYAPTAQRLTCVGHYPAQTAAPMVTAIARRWGPGRAGAGPYAGALVWTFRVKDGAVTPVTATGGLSADDAPPLAPGEAHAYVQVFYNPALGDVASLIAVSRPVR
jgi:hypothetical protein